MEFVEGSTLAQLLARLKEAKPGSETPFGPKDQVEYFAGIARTFADVADGLQHAHSKGVIHRDIKPSNLILDREGRLRILDFGLAHIEGRESLTASGDFLGTLLYMSPEQARRQKIPVDHRTDIYSLGATLYEVLVGHPPLLGKDYQDTLSQIVERDPVEPRRLDARIPRDLETIVLKCLRKDPADRYGTAEALAQDLRRFARGDPVEARPAGGWERLLRRMRRWRTLLVVSAVFVVLAGVAGWLGYRALEEERARILAEYEPAVRSAVLRLVSAEARVRASPARGGRHPLAAGSVYRSALGARELTPLLGESALRPLEEAREILEAQTKALPERRDAHYHLARVYIMLGQDDLAMEEVQKTLEIDPCFAPARFLESDRRLGWGEERFKQGSGNGEGWGALWLAAAEARWRCQWALVAEEYDKLLSLCEAGKEPFIGFAIDAHLTRGAARLELKEWDLAQEDFVAVRSQAPACLEAWLLLGKTYLLEGKAEVAERTFETMLAGSTALATEEPALWISGVYLSLNDYGEAAAWAGRIKDTASRELLAAHVHSQCRDWRAAAEAGRRAVEADPDGLPPRRLLARAILNRVLEERETAAASFLELAEACRRAVEIDPDDRESRFLLEAAWDAVCVRSSGFSSREIADLGEMLLEAVAAAGLPLPGAGSGAGADGFRCGGGDILDCDPVVAVYDDFRDGVVFDGNPVRWIRVPSRPGEFPPAEGGGVEVRALENISPWFTLERISTGDVSVRARASFNRTSPVAAPWHGKLPFLAPLLHVEDTGTGLMLGYWGGVVLDGKTYISNYPGRRLKVGQLDFDPGEGDLYIELSRKGNDLELRVWRPEPGEPDDAHPRGRPETPQLACTNATHHAGRAGFMGWSTSGNPVILRSLWISREEVTVPSPPGTFRRGDVNLFRRGDANDDGAADTSDAIAILGHLFLGTTMNDCEDAADVDDDGQVDISDAVRLLGHLLGGSERPPDPFDACGEDTTEDELNCSAYSACP